MLDIFGTYHINPATPIWSGASTIRYPLLSQRERKRDGDMQEKKLSDFLNGLPLTICRYAETNLRTKLRNLNLKLQLSSSASEPDQEYKLAVAFFYLLNLNKLGLLLSVFYIVVSEDH